MLQGREFEITTAVAAHTISIILESLRVVPTYTPLDPSSSQIPPSPEIDAESKKLAK